MAHQYLEQAKPAVRQAVFGNAGSMIAFRVGGPDGDILETVFRPDRMTSQHFLDLNKYEVIASIPDGAAAPKPFLGMTLPPVQYPAGRKDVIIALCRQKFARSRSIVEPRINKLFGDAAAGKSPPVLAGVARRHFARRLAQ
jgi:hypothetical protein